MKDTPEQQQNTANQYRETRQRLDNLEHDLDVLRDQRDGCKTKLEALAETLSSYVNTANPLKLFKCGDVFVDVHVDQSRGAGAVSVIEMRKLSGLAG